MPIFGATHCCRIVCRLRSQSVSIPWLLKADVRACLEGRVYSSSVPVRYKPKKKRESLLQTSPPASSSGKAVRCPGSNPVGLGALGGGSGGQNQFQKPFVSPCNSQNRCGLPMKISDHGLGPEAFVSDKTSQNQCKLRTNDSEPEKKIDHHIVEYVVGQKAFVSANTSQNQCKLSMSDSGPGKKIAHDIVDYGVGQKAFVSANKSQNQCKLPMNNSDYGVDQKAFVSATKSQNQCKLPMNDSESDEEIDDEVVEYGLGLKAFDSDKKSQNQCKLPANNSDCGLGRELGEGFEEFTIDRQKDDHERNVSLVNKIKQEAEKLAVQLLAKRAFTTAELRKKLHGNNFSSDIVEVVLNDFQGRGLINDCLYAETYSRSRWSSLSWGPKRIKHALSRKGVSAVDVEKAVTLVFREGMTDENQDSKFGLSKPSIDHLFVQASKQWLRGQGLPSVTRKSRIVRWLMYRGFNWNVINYILRKLEFQSPP